MTEIKYTAAEQRAIRAAMGHIESLVEQDFRDEQRVRACRKAERKERSSQTVADANCIGWFFSGAHSPLMTIKSVVHVHNECLMMTVLGVKYSSGANEGVLTAAIEAHKAAWGRWLDAMKTT